MNNNDRKKLQEAISLIQEAHDIISLLSEQEQEKFDNLSEGLQETERGQAFQDNAYNLEEYKDTLSEVMSNLEDLNP